MTNSRARKQILANYHRYLRMWRYALARHLSFAHRYARKLQACIDALGRSPIPLTRMLAVEVYAQWK